MIVILGVIGAIVYTGNWWFIVIIILTSASYEHKREKESTEDKDEI
jgi:uncharacterized membrane protein